MPILYRYPSAVAVWGGARLPTAPLSLLLLLIILVILIIVEFAILIKDCSDTSKRCTGYRY